MLKSVIKKILGFFSVAQTEREIEVVEHGVRPGGVVYRIHGREVYAPSSTRKENGVTVYVHDLREAYYCKFTVDLSERSGHGQPNTVVDLVSHPLTVEDHDVLVRQFEALIKKDAEAAKQGSPVSFKRELIRFYPPRPIEDAGSHPQIKSDAQPR